MVDRFHQQKFLAIILILILGTFLFSAGIKFIAVFVSALILFTLFKPLYDKFEKKVGKPVSASFIIVISFFILVIPFLIIGSFAVDEIIDLNERSGEIYILLEDGVAEYDATYPELKISERLQNVIEEANEFISNLIGPLVQNTANLLITIVLMYFVLFFLLTNTRNWEKRFYEFLPFSRENSLRLTEEFSGVTKSTIIGSGIIALVQGSLLGVSLFLVGIEGAIIWGFVGVILSFLPIIGIPIVWFPVSLFLLFTGQYMAGILFFIFHFVVTSNIDTLLRVVINRKIANIHPLTSVLGVFFGLYLFGLVGIILGPLLISYFFLFIEIYKEEYM